MSVEYDLYCKNCNKAVWFCCDGFSGAQFPHKNEELMESIRLFLREHLSCEPRVVIEIDDLHEDAVYDYDEDRPNE